MNFYNRFDIKIDVRTAQRRLVNRLFDSVFRGVLLLPEMHPGAKEGLEASVAYAIGERYSPNVPFSRIVGLDFHMNLLAVETAYHLSRTYCEGTNIQEMIGNCIMNALRQCETDISIGWEAGKFVRKGARELDNALVNQPLQWLAGPEFVSVKEPFEKSLRLFLEAQKRPELYSDVITNAYESLEALAKIVTQRDKDLSGNADSFLKALSLSSNFRPVFKEYLKYANHFRHGVSQKKARPAVPEVESFVYMTGLFIRLSIIARAR